MAHSRLPHPAGPILITHFTLLLGMAAPVWLSNALEGSSIEAAAQLEQEQPLWLAAYAGIMILGEVMLVHCIAPANCVELQLDGGAAWHVSS